RIQDVADFDHDQLPDLVLKDGLNEWIQAWTNLGALNFNLTARLFSYFDSAAISADFDGDGISDVLGQSRGLNTLLLGSTSMVFASIELPLGLANVPVVA